MKIKKILKITGIIILVLIVLILVHTLRNFIIIRKLQSNISEYKNKTNYHMSMVSHEHDGIIMTTDYYKKDDKEAFLIERNMNGDISKISLYNTAGKKDMFTQRDDEKVAKLNTDSILTVQIYNGVDRESGFITFISSLFARIKSVKVNDKDCYAVTAFVGVGPFVKNEYYIEKDTGLLVRNVTDYQTADRQYEFDNVDDSVFIEPDISEYTIKED